MGKIRVTVKKTYLRSQTSVDKNGRRHCQTCGAYIGNKGRKK